ncbi:PadR family transcriptional regulator [Leptolinea tardivitalis]|uniref:PadR family transcriptional regulator n=1 Tax=Leptolinea tardivitalis TaxID=229920 RepID=A0A0P6WT15_9CHLR|nr:helix-turn-helix transcriptional regulator [Leptolinea tardivitalis]KPL73380.1 PadR family transcriptional regulator [Leptolinea tardivitalis]GAP21521.1 transcriptional regulator, PadR family [Leptolinea tardivitalis]
MLNKELVAASSTPLILSILAEGESYGYEIIQRISELSEEEISWSEGMLYPVLHRLEKEELVTSEWRLMDSGRKRKYYRLNKKGVSALQEEKHQWGIVNNTLNRLWKGSYA